MPKTLKISVGKNGKNKAINDIRNLNIANYLSKTVETSIPDCYDWTLVKNTDWGIYHNDTLNNCTCASAAHLIKCWTSNAKTEAIIQDTEVLNTYALISGYDLETGQNDDGAYALDALKQWRKNGIGQHKIKAFATISHDNRDAVKTAIYIFGGIYVGLLLPKSIIGQEIWSVMPGALVGDNEPASWGGHAVAIVAYNQDHLTCITMGKEQKMTWEFWETYNDEAYAIITEDFFNGSKTPSGFNLPKMEEDLMTLTGQKIRLAKQLDQTDQAYKS